MEDNQLDIVLKAYFSDKIPLENSLVMKTKIRLREKSNKKNTFLLCLIQIGFWLMTLAFSALIIITAGVNTVIIISIVGCIAGMSLIGTILVLASLKNTDTTRRRRVYG